MRKQQSTQSPLLGREDLPSLTNDWECTSWSLSLSLLRAYLARVDRLKRWPTGLVCSALGFSFPLTFQFSVPVPVPTSGTSSLDEEVFSSALQSNGNDCAPGEPENCICVLELSGVMRLRGKHAWIRVLSSISCYLAHIILNLKTRSRVIIIAQ